KELLFLKALNIYGLRLLRLHSSNTSASTSPPCPIQPNICWLLAPLMAGIKVKINMKEHNAPNANSNNLLPAIFIPGSEQSYLLVPIKKDFLTDIVYISKSNTLGYEKNSYSTKPCASEQYRFFPI